MTAKEQVGWGAIGNLDPGRKRRETFPGLRQEVRAADVVVGIFEIYLKDISVFDWRLREESSGSGVDHCLTTSPDLYAKLKGAEGSNSFIG